jgi:hypothetical protein
MTTPAAPTAPTLVLATDAASYLVGATINLTVTYADAQSVPSTLNINVSGTDAQGNDVTATTSVIVTQNTSEPMTISATDSFGDTWAVVSNDGVSTAVLSAVVGTPPAAPVASPTPAS